MQAMRGRLALTLLILLAAAARPASYARGTLHVCVARTGGPLALRGGQGAHSSGRSASSGGRDDGQNATADDALYTDSEAEASDTILERSMRGTGRSDMETLRHLEQEFRGQLSSLQSGANPTGHSGGSTQEGRAGAQGLASMLAGGSVGLDPGVAARLDREHQELFGVENPLRFLSSDRQQQRNLASQLQTEILEAGVGETAPPVVDDGPRDSDDSSDPRQRHTTSGAKAPHDVGAREAEDHIDIQTGEDAVHDVVESGADAGGDADMTQSDDSEAASAAAWGSSRDDSTSLSRDSLLSMPGPDDQPIRDDKSSGRDQARSVAVARRRRGVRAGASLEPAAWNASEVQDMTDKACISLPTGEEQGYKGYGAAAKRASAQRPVCSSTHTKAQVLDDREDAMLVEEEAGAAWAAWEGQEGQEVDVAVEEALLKEAEEQPGDIIVPDMHNNVPEAVLLAHDKAYGTDSVLLRAGQHSFTTYNYGRLEVLRSLRVKAQPGALVLGRWIMLEGSSGCLRHVRCLSRTASSPTDRVLFDPTVYIRGGRGWRFVNCDIRSAGAVSALVTRDSKVLFLCTSMGGALQRKYRNDFDKLFCASEALTVLGEARVSVEKCSFEDSFGPGASFMGSSVCRVCDSFFLRTAIGTVFDWETRTSVVSTTYMDTYEGAFMNMPGDTNTTVTLLDNLVHGFVWCTNKRPDKLHIRRNNFNHTFPEQWSYLQEVHGQVECERQVASTKWVQRELPDGLVPLATDFPY